ncbi:TonB-dependent receptor [Aestuariibacter sp. GS-14]|uniref:TonB-dependent receptor n=1 Tax=Aestuariibacter sp. GS-14 TaxID=2590670 RepID=UPI0011292AD9|nr:TonB-dependent receptor [Aestuariibacter sp. GS-14]TPV61795.1 TonB-dependent receptor [Aestuariibacter sp. GS-14]
MFINVNRQMSTLAVAISLALLPHAAQSQTTEMPKEDNGTIEKIQVTATKRATEEQTTGIAMVVLDDKALKDSGVTELNDLANVAPTLNIAQNNDNTLITIRGVSSRDYSETGDPAVAVSIDNFYLQDSKGLNAAIFDIQQVEVLRGPQGTLHGRNATAGAVNMITAKPTFAKEYRASVDVGNYDTVDTELMANIPVNDELAVRVAGIFRDTDGYRDNGLAENGDAKQEMAGRIHVRYEPSEDFSALLTAELVDVDGTGSVLKGISYEDINSDGTLQLGDDKKWDLNNQGVLNIKTQTFRWEFNYNLNDYTVSYLGGNRNLEFDRNNDQDGGTNAGWGFKQGSEVDTVNHEVRLTSNLNGPFNFQTGLYYFDQEGKGPAYFQLDVGADEPLDIYTFDYVTTSESKAVFLQSTFDITDDLMFESGIRYTDDKKTQTGQADVGTGTFSQVDNAFSDDEVTWHLGLNWTQSDDHFFYAKIDRGYKAGGFKDTSSYTSEEILAYEVGSKSFLLDNTMQLNSSVFYYDYTDLQVQQTNPDTGVAQVYNAGEASIYGAELDMKYRPTKQDNVTLNLSLLKAEYDDFCTVSSSTCPSENDYSGNELPQAPSFAAAFGYSHDFVFENSLLTAKFQTRYQGENYFSYRNIATEYQEAYTKSDLILKYSIDGSAFEYSAYVRNIEDQKILTLSEEAGYAGGYLVQFAAPRTFGVKVTYEY